MVDLLGTYVWIMTNVNDGECNGVCYIPDPSIGENTIVSGFQFMNILAFFFIILIAVIGACIGCCTSRTKTNDNESSKRIQ